MPSELTTKRSPIVLIWKFAAVEVAGFILYFIATLFGNAKVELYTQLSLSSFLSYQAAKLLFLSITEFALTVYAFLSWYYEDYTIRPGSILHMRGVFRKKAESFPIDQLTKPTLLSGPFARLFHYGSIRVESGASSFTVATISHPERIVKALRGESESLSRTFGKEPDAARLLAEAEHDQLEFKSSLRFDYKLGKVNRELEKAAMKTVAAFLNSKGGCLVVGVSDARAPLGLAGDYESLPRKDSDGFENHFTQLFNSMIGPEFRNFIKLRFQRMGDCDLCVVQALASPRPVYLKLESSEHFYVRTGNTSTALKLSEVESYSRSRWPVALS